MSDIEKNPAKPAMQGTKSDSSSDDVSLGHEVYDSSRVDPVLARKMALVNAAIDEIGMTPFQWKLFVFNGFGYAVDSVSATVTIDINACAELASCSSCAMRLRSPPWTASLAARTRRLRAWLSRLRLDYSLERRFGASRPISSGGNWPSTLVSSSARRLC